MTSENKMPECGHPFCADTCGSVAIEASAAMESRQNALIDTLRDELAKEKAKSARLVECLREAAGHAGVMLPEWKVALATYEVKT